MKRLVFGYLLTLSLALLAPWSSLRADVKLPNVLGSHMVVQRDRPLPIWGTADTGEDVAVTLGDKTEKTKADDKGNWKVTLPALKADGKTHKITVAGKNTIELNDILVGEVWIGYGQSNMEWSLISSTDAAATIAAAEQPKIRLLQVPKAQAKEPAKDVQAVWQVCTPKTVPNFSAVLYHFGLRLQKDLDVPIGLINSSWGGSPIEPWTVTDKTSGGMYNGMIAPLQPFPVRGVTWYQGETNAIQKNGLKYRDKMEDLIKGWRKAWGQDMPFYFVQIAPWSGNAYPPGELEALWEAQVASLKIPGTGMVVVTDLVDNVADIHPKNKKDVGNRLALWADEGLRQEGSRLLRPALQEHEGGGRQGALSFAHVAGGLKSRDGKPLSEFEIAGRRRQVRPRRGVMMATRRRSPKV